MDAHARRNFCTAPARFPAGAVRFLPMKQSRPWLRVCRRCAHNVGSACVTSVCWLLWIALTASLVLLATIYFRREISVPDFLLRRLEQKLEFAHLCARFGRTA